MRIFCLHWYFIARMNDKKNLSLSLYFKKSISVHYIEGTTIYLFIEDGSLMLSYGVHVFKSTLNVQNTTTFKNASLNNIGIYLDNS